MTRILQFLKAFRVAQRGVAATEFAILLPFLALLYCGSIETYLLIRADREANVAVSSVADLAARMEIATNCEVDNLYAAAQLIISKQDVADIGLRLSSISLETQQPTIMWSTARGPITARQRGETASVDDGLKLSSGSLILAEISFSLDSAISSSIQNMASIDKSYMVAPRKSLFIKSDFSANNDCAPSDPGSDPAPTHTHSGTHLKPTKLRGTHSQ